MIDCTYAWRGSGWYCIRFSGGGGMYCPGGGDSCQLCESKTALDELYADALDYACSLGLGVPLIDFVCPRWMCER